MGFAEFDLVKPGPIASFSYTASTTGVHCTVAVFTRRRKRQKMRA
jgi:hypothetical protein